MSKLSSKSLVYEPHSFTQSIHTTPKGQGGTWITQGNKGSGNKLTTGNV
jgi:hypothetical protein